MSTIDITFNPNPVQKLFIESRARADLFSSRMGEGKSAALAWSIYYHTTHNPGASWVLIRDTWENLRATTQKEFFKWFPPNIMGTYHVQNKEWRWAEGVAKGTVSFIGLDDPSDASKLQSRELAGFAIDEPAPAATSGGVDELIFDIGLSRLRQPEMNWYGVKLAENNPDESHWTYRRFVDPGTEGFSCWQPGSPENEKHLPDGYYADLRRLWGHRPDLQRRFIEGKFGFQSIGKAVTPQWSDEIHLAVGLVPVRGSELTLLWDFGHNPTCIITQITPMGHWNVLDAFVGEDEGVEELITNLVAPVLVRKYRGFRWSHIGDPAGLKREETSIHRTPVKMIRKHLGGIFRAGPVRPDDRIEPLRAVLTRLRGGKGLVQVDRLNAAPVWYALRGGWHFHTAKTGVVSVEAVKDKHSHPGDAMSYGAALLYPTRTLQSRGRPGLIPAPVSAWSQAGPSGGLGFERPGARVPRGPGNGIGR